MSDCDVLRNQEPAYQGLLAYRLGDASERARWRAILAGAKARHIDSLTLRECIALAMLAPDMSAEGVLEYIVKNVKSAAAADLQARANVIPLFDNASVEG